MRGRSRQQTSLVSDGGHVQMNLEEEVIQLGGEAILSDQCQQKCLYWWYRKGKQLIAETRWC